MQSTASQPATRSLESNSSSNHSSTFQASKSAAEPRLAFVFCSGYRLRLLRRPYSVATVRGRAPPLRRPPAPRLKVVLEAQFHDAHAALEGRGAEAAGIGNLHRCQSLLRGGGGAGGAGPGGYVYASQVVV